LANGQTASAVASDYSVAIESETPEDM